MKTISVTELKRQLSAYIRRAQRGQEVQIVNRGRPVARLVGMGGSSADGDARRERLVAAGVLAVGEGNARAALDEPPIRLPGAKLSESLAEERGDRA